MSDYLPARESELKEFALNFAALIVAAPNTYGLVAGDATTIDEAVQDFATKWTLVQQPATRNTPAIEAKNVAKRAMLPILRGYAMQIKVNRAVTNDAKVALGLVMDDFIRTPAPVPITYPILKVMGTTPRRHLLRWNDSAIADLRAKPAGVLGMELFCHVGATPPEDPGTSRIKLLVTRQPFRVDFQTADVGKMAWCSGRWITATGLVGPLGVPVGMTISGLVVNQA